MATRYDVQVRWADLDLLGHVNNVRAMEYFQDARVAFVHEVGYSIGPETAGADIDGVTQVIARHEIDYVAPILLPHGHVSVESSIERVGRSSYTILHVATIPDGTVVLRGRATMVCVDRATGSSTPIPDPWREVLARHSTPA